jgi:transcriptional regulator with XRE-family HTH domain
MMTDIIHQPRQLGENLKRLRMSTDTTLQQAADTTGLSKSFLSMVENGSRTVQFQDLRRIVQAYRYSLGWFLTQTQDVQHDVAQPSSSNKTRTATTLAAKHLLPPVIATEQFGLLMAGERKQHALQLRLHRPLRSLQDVEVVSLVLPRQSQLTEHEMTIDTTVRGVVRQGTLLIVLQGDEYIAREGDEFCFDGSIPHLFRNYTSEVLAATLIIHPPLL